MNKNPNEEDEKQAAVKLCVNSLHDVISGMTEVEFRKFLDGWLDRNLDLNVKGESNEAFDSVDNLMWLARSGSMSAFTSLHELAVWISDFLMDSGMKPEKALVYPIAKPDWNLGCSARTLNQGMEKFKKDLTEKNACAEALNYLRSSKQDFPLGQSLYAGDDIVERLVDVLVTDRISRRSHEIVQLLAARFWQWPVVVPAFEDGRDDLLKSEIGSLELGWELPFRMKMKKGRGASREFRRGSQTRFAVEMAYALEQERNKLYKNYLGLGRRRQRKLIEKLKPKLEPIARTKCVTPSPVNVRVLNSYWRAKASLLDKFSDSSMKEWVDVAMLRARWLCRDNWEKYKWPDCVEGRIGIRSAKAAVKEKLTSGMKSLL